MICLGIHARARIANPPIGARHLGSAPGLRKNEHKSQFNTRNGLQNIFQSYICKPIVKYDSTNRK